MPHIPRLIEIIIESLELVSITADVNIFERIRELMYIVCTHRNCLYEAILMDTYNILLF